MVCILHSQPDRGPCSLGFSVLLREPGLVTGIRHECLYDNAKCFIPLQHQDVGCEPSGTELDEVHEAWLRRLSLPPQMWICSDLPENRKRLTMARARARVMARARARARARVMARARARARVMARASEGKGESEGDGDEGESKSEGDGEGEGESEGDGEEGEGESEGHGEEGESESEGDGEGEGESEGDGEGEGESEGDGEGDSDGRDICLKIASDLPWLVMNLMTSHESAMGSENTLLSHSKTSVIDLTLMVAWSLHTFFRKLSTE